MSNGTVIFIWILLGFLITCAISATICKKLITTVLIFMSYSLVMSIVWIILESPDLAGTEAAVGAGVTTILFFITLKRVRAIKTKKDDKETKDREEDDEQQSK